MEIARTLGDEELANQYQARVKTLQMGLKRHIEAHPFLYRDREREKYYSHSERDPKNAIAVLGEMQKLNRQRGMRSRFQNALKDGIIKAEVNEQLQNVHIRGTEEWNRRFSEDKKKGKVYLPSYLTVDLKTTEELVRRYSGTGQFKYNGNKDYIPKREIASHTEKIGVYIDQDTGEQFETEHFRIHYRKTGSHIVPTLKGKT